MQVVEAHGARIPTIGLGTMTLKEDVCVQAVKTALQIGYRHLDTAAFYGNETENGEGLRRSGIKREEVFICTKVRQGDLMPDAFAKVLEQSLANLKLPYVDLLLIHWPSTEVPLDWALGEFAKLRKQGKTRTIGVSNFPTALLRQALGIVDDLAANQVEYHPYLSQRPLLELMRERDLVLIAHSPLARGAVLDDPVLQEIAQRRKLSVAQVALRWIVQQERVVAIPGAQNVEQLRENLRVLDFKLTNDEMAAISALARGTRIVDPKHGPAWDPA